MQYPRHVALIPDGNRTRAKANGKDVGEAYMISYAQAVEVIKHLFSTTDTKVFTLRGLSTDNAKKRPKEDFDFLMNMYKFIGGELDEFLIANKINFKIIGDLNGITDGFKEYLLEKEKITKCDSDRYCVFGINYGGKDEIIRGIQKLATQGCDFNKIDEEALGKAMDLGDIPPVELVIRTKGNMATRTSGLMSRRIGYAELYFTAKKCPEFAPADMQEAFVRFDKMAAMRNYGK